MLYELLLLPNGDAIEAHTVTDQRIWGLFDVALQRPTLFPRTIYKVTGDSASGVVGVLYPDGRFLVKASTNIGTTFECKALADESTWAETVWDGAAPAVEFPREDGTMGVESSHGLLLGDIEIHRMIHRVSADQRGRHSMKPEAIAARRQQKKKKKKNTERAIITIDAPGTLTASDNPRLRAA